jgi:hypothetical protein
MIQHPKQRRSHLSISTSPKSMQKTFISHFVFKKKYLSILLLGLGSALLLFLLPAFVLVLQNYNLLKEIAPTIDGSLFFHYQRETVWLCGFLIASFAMVLGIVYLFGLKIINKMLGPIYEVEQHLSKISTGDWTEPTFEHNQNDDLFEFLDLYSYTIRTFKSRIEVELKILERLNVDPNDRDAYDSWLKLIELKRSQVRGLNKTEASMPMPANDDSALSDESHWPRRAS